LLLAASQIPLCDERALPFRDETSRSDLRVNDVALAQKRGVCAVEVTVHNLGLTPIHGVLVQVELFDQQGNLLLALAAIGEEKDTRAVSRTAINLLVPRRQHRTVRWERPLLPGRDDQVQFPYTLALPKCPTSAHVSVFAVLDSQGEWHRVSTRTLRQMPLLTDIKLTPEEMTYLWQQFSGPGAMTLTVNVDQTGAASLSAAQPFPAGPDSRLAAIVSRWRFQPGWDGVKPVAQSVNLLLSFGRPFELAAQYPFNLSGSAVWMVGVSRDHIQGPDSAFFTPEPRDR
jgi:hypothetical protein